LGSRRESWIPILGRSAAGVPQFWSAEGEESGAATLAELASRHAAYRPSRAEPASASGPKPLRDVPVQLVTLEGPDDSDVAEYVVCEGLKARHADAFAVRIDGASMSPEIRHGDVVVLSPSAPAADGRPAVVQLRRQIGVTCKLFRRQGDSVHLVPVSEQFAPQSFPAGEVVWALRVLATIRPARAASGP
jgi:phage repressor protein C with HTH and peptisase S24 domain